MSRETKKFLKICAAHVVFLPVLWGNMYVAPRYSAVIDNMGGELTWIGELMFNSRTLLCAAGTITFFSLFTFLWAPARHCQTDKVQVALFRLMLISNFVYVLLFAYAMSYGGDIPYRSAQMVP